jgi:hypothetical protein
LPVKHTLAAFFPDLNLSRIRVREGIPWYVRGDPLAYADRNRLYFRPGAYRPDAIEGMALIGHELMHSRQYRELGTWRFRMRYLASYFRNRLRGMSAREAYLEIPFEIEARAVEEQIRRALGRPCDIPHLEVARHRQPD